MPTVSWCDIVGGVSSLNWERSAGILIDRTNRLDEQHLSNARNLGVRSITEAIPGANPGLPDPRLAIPVGIEPASSVDLEL